ncbi:hypothetical protein [Luteibacter sp.]|jgi:hypothetical protein|uniref:hypothetical protein n=1 Tax=Luteibacter sp. TaxID=1886636 RepID=UPI002F406094
MKYLLTALMYGMLALSVLFFLKGIDSISEIDDLKSHINSQKRVIVFLKEVNDHAIASCAIKAEAFDELLKRSSYASGNRWINERILFGPFLAERTNDCISRIDLLARPL